MRIRMLVVVAGLATALVGIGPLGGTARADEAPSDPTRGQWDSFLDPLRDFEDNSVTATQKSVEDATKIHLGLGFTEAYSWDFNKPRSGSLIALHSLEHHNDGVPVLGQLAASRPSEGWFVPGFGLKLDAGKVARDVKADWNGNGAVKHGDTFETNDFDVQEAYLTWTMPDDGPSSLKGLSLKGGKFVTLLGAEVIEPWSNFNYSRSFVFSLAIPFTQTGALVSYPISDKLSVTGGAVEGWDKVQSNNHGWSGIGNVTYTATDQVTLAANGIWGPEQTNKTGNKRGVADLVATIKPTSALTLLLNYDWGHEEAAAAGNEAALWQGFAAVANYAFTDRASAAVRGEWFEDHGGTRTGAVQSLYEATVTGKYLITQHLYGQLEYRHDVSGKGAPFPKDSPGQVNSSTGPIPITKFRDDQDILAFDVTYLFN
jgi:hypothetical protein